MQYADLPTPFPIPFANSAGPSFKRAIPTASQVGITPGAASLTDGFPPDNFSPVEAGGIPPAGQDFNGILAEITEAIQFLQAGCGIPFFDPTFASEIGGYPLHAVLQSTAGAGNFWVCTVDNNSANPDTGGAGWSAFPGPSLVQPSVTQTGNGTYNFNCATDVSLGLDRSAPAAMTANLAATGTLVLNQVFEIADLSGNLSSGVVTVNPPAGGHTINGAPTYTMNKDGQYVKFKYFGNKKWGAQSS